MHRQDQLVRRINQAGLLKIFFSVWFNHFIKTIQPKSRSQPTLLIADGHSSHIRNLEIVETARENNVIILILPRHCTHQLQPCDVSFFRNLNLYNDDDAALWLKEHPFRAICKEHVVQIFHEGYSKAATMNNAQSGFRQSGIHPFNPNIFTDADFMAAHVTDRPLGLCVSLASKCAASSSVVEEQVNSTYESTGRPDELQSHFSTNVTEAVYDIPVEHSCGRADQLQSETSANATDAVNNIPVEHSSGKANGLQSQTSTNVTQAVYDIQVGHSCRS